MKPNRLTSEAIQLQLSAIPRWKLQDDGLFAEFHFTTFAEALAFIVQVGLEAEKSNHHPELWNTYNRVSLRLTTHDAGGITQLDFDLATQIDAMLNPGSYLREPG